MKVVRANLGYTPHTVAFGRLTQTYCRPHCTSLTKSSLGFRIRDAPPSQTTRRSHVPKAARTQKVSLDTRDPLSELPEELTSEGFDVATAAVLGGCAFHAYESPGEDGKELKFCGEKATMHYYDRDLVKSIYSSVLEVKVLRAKLPKRDDAFVEVSLGRNTSKSNICKGTSTPNWQKTFRFPVRLEDKRKIEEGENRVEIQVKSQGPMGTTFLLSSATLTEKDLAASDAEVEVDLTGNGGGGKLYVSARVQPISDVEKGGSYDTQWDYPSDSKGSEILEEWADLAGKESKRYTPVCFLSANDTGTQAWIYANIEEKELAVSFRGTSSDKDKEIDVGFKTACLEIGDSEYLDTLDDPKVHGGFSRAYLSIQEDIARSLDSIAKDSNWKVHVTGHSLGAALATLCAFDLATRKDFRPAVQMYNFGSPRVYNCSSAEAYGNKVVKSWRVANCNDSVTTIPKSMVYRHVNAGIELDKNGTLKLLEVRKGGSGVFAPLRNNVKFFLSYVGTVWDNMTGNKAHRQDAYLGRMELCIKNYKGQ